MIQAISIQDLFTKFKSLNKKDELILDVRTPEEYAEGHVPGSRNISHEGVSAYSKDLQAYKTVYVYCRSGGRVQKACGDLAQLGLKNLVAVAGGGMPDWISNGYPVER